MAKELVGLYLHLLYFWDTDLFLYRMEHIQDLGVS